MCYDCVLRSEIHEVGMSGTGLVTLGIGMNYSSLDGFCFSGCLIVCL